MNSLWYLLTNITFVGKLRYKREVHGGVYQAIIDSDLWQRIQSKFQRNGRTGCAMLRNMFGAILMGMIHCVPCGCAMSPTRATKNGTKRNGHYRPEELFQAARRSRACAYLADDDHGPLALQEILLAGCPTVGVRTGASFVRDGVTGYLVERLPPGRECVASESDAVQLGLYLEAMRQAQSLDRVQVWSAAATIFSTDLVVNRLLAELNERRTLAN